MNSAHFIREFYNTNKSARIYIIKNELNSRACLHGGVGPLVGEVSRLGGVTCLSI